MWNPDSLFQKINQAIKSYKNSHVDVIKYFKNGSKGLFCEFGLYDYKIITVSICDYCVIIRTVFLSNNNQMYWWWQNRHQCEIEPTVHSRGKSEFNQFFID